MFILKIGLKNTQNHNVAWGLGFLYLLVFRPPYYIQMKFKGSFQLPWNRFMSSDVEYLIFGRRTKLGEISILATFCYHFMHKNNVLTARDIPQIHLLLGKFECKKLLIKICWDFLRSPIESPKLFFTYIQNTLEDIIHWNYAKILIYKTWKFFDLRKYAFFGHFPISSNFIRRKPFWCWSSVDWNITDRSETYF